MDRSGRHLIVGTITSISGQSEENHENVQSGQPDLRVRWFRRDDNLDDEKGIPYACPGAISTLEWAIVLQSCSCLKNTSFELTNSENESSALVLSGTSVCLTRNMSQSPQELKSQRLCVHVTEGDE